VVDTASLNRPREGAKLIYNYYHEGAIQESIYFGTAKISWESVKAKT
jgi:hypothetical protein